MNKEYIYNIDKYTIGVDENGKDEIGLTIAIIKNGEINVLGNCYGENARCLDLLIEENNELKKQLEDKEDYINKLQATKDKLDKWDYENTMQQKEFIKYLEDEIKINTPKARWKHYNEDGFNDYDVENGGYIENQPVNVILTKVLQKYKSIIGVSDENKAKV